MYLTRMHLNPHRRGTRHLLASPQRMHAAVLCGFPPGSGTETPDGRTLWRLDRGSGAALTLYVSSPARPDLTHIVEQAGWPTAPDPWQTGSMDALLSRLEAGGRWAFRLTANPVRSQSRGEGKRGKRLAHVTARQQEDWLVARSTGWGFSLETGEAPSLRLIERATSGFDRHSDGERNRVTIGTATFDGHLVVTDADLLSRSLRHGMGRAKGYGCGLMTLAPLT